MNILVTGHLGFIGSALFAHLTATTDHNIMGLEADIFEHDDWQNYIQELLDTYQPDVVFHIGACTDTLETDVNYMMIRNFESTKIIADYCTANGVPLVYSSSAASYGVNSAYPSNLYGWSKYVAEQYVIHAGGIALRYFNVYGPGESHKGRMASVAYQMWKQTDPIKLFRGSPQRDFVYVTDVVSANIFAFDNYNSLKKTYYDVGTSEPQSFESVMELMGLEFGYQPTSVIPIGYQFYTCSDRKKWLPGWAPKYSLAQGILEYTSYLNSKS